MRKQPTNGAICLSKCQQAGLVDMQLQQELGSSWETEAAQEGCWCWVNAVIVQ